MALEVAQKTSTKVLTMKHTYSIRPRLTPSLAPIAISQITLAYP